MQYYIQFRSCILIIESDFLDSHDELIWLTPAWESWRHRAACGMRAMRLVVRTEIVPRMKVLKWSGRAVGVTLSSTLSESNEDNPVLHFVGYHLGHGDDFFTSLDDVQQCFMDLHVKRNEQLIL